MFTGLIQDVGEICRADARADGQGAFSLTIGHRLRADSDDDLALGESVSINGCCLSVSSILSESQFAVELSAETLARTGGADAWSVGRRVNLERALRVGDRLGGHIVQGHVDGQLSVGALRLQTDGCAELEVELDLSQSRYLIEKGSIALDGVSLTIARLSATSFTVALIPITLSDTNLGQRSDGDRVNVEYDLFAKYAERWLAVRS